MRGRYLVFGIFILMLIGIGSASTTINIKTLPYHTVFVTPTSGGDSLLMPIKNVSDLYGDVSFIFDEDDEEITESFYGLIILVKDLSDKAVYYKEKSTSYEIGEESELILAFPEGTEPIWRNETEEVPEENNESETNNSSVEQEGLNVSNEDSEEKKGIFSSAFGVVDGNKSVFYTIYYLLMMFVLLAVLFFAFKGRITSVSRENKDDSDKDDNKKERRVKNKKRGKLKINFNFLKSNNKDIEDLTDTDELAVAEKQLKEVQKKVDRLRAEKKESLTEAKKKLIEAEKEIMKLRGVKIDKDEDVSSEDMKKRLKE